MCECVCQRKREIEDDCVPDCQSFITRFFQWQQNNFYILFQKGSESKDKLQLASSFEQKFGLKVNRRWATTFPLKNDDLMQRDAAAWSHCDSTLHQRASSPSSSSSSSSSPPLLSFDQFLERNSEWDDETELTKS